MESAPFYIVDVFAETKYAGNQLAVVRNGHQFSDARMQEIAREANFSETTFIIADAATIGSYEVRIFTPQEEIPFAGHPTLGTAFVIQQEILGRQKVPCLRLKLKAGTIPVDLEYANDQVTNLTMTQLPPTFGATLPANEVAAAVGVPTSQIEKQLPVQEVSTGTPFIVVPVKSLEAVQKAVVDRDKHDALIAGTDAKAILLFSRQTVSQANHVHVRMFAPYYGVSEDPATGSANGCLAGYLVKHSAFDANSISVRAEQGLEMGRPSLLLLRAWEEGDRIHVQVGGRAFMVVRGHLV